MFENWPYFKILKNSLTLFSTKEEVESSLRAGYVMTDDPDEDLLDNPFGKNPQREKNKYMKERLQKHLDALETHTEEYIRLYNLQFAINNFYSKKDPNDENSEEFLPAKANIDIDDDNNPKMTVEMFAPIGADLIVDDETATFDPTGLTVPRMKAIVELMERHQMIGDVKGLELENCDENLKDMLEQAKTEFVEEHREPSRGNISSDDNQPVSDEDFENAGREENTSASGATAQTSWGEPSKQQAKNTLDDKERIEKANKIFENWLNKNKKKGSSWYLGYDWNGGWTTFMAYPTESNDIFRKPVTRTLNGDVKYNYELEIRTRIRNGVVEIEFSVPAGGKLNEDQAANIAAAFKAAGVKYVAFNGMTDANEAAMRLGCANKGIIPTNHNINFEKYDKMINMAGIKMDKNSPEFYRYQYDLAMQVDKNLQKKGIYYRDEKNKNNPECRRIRWAVGAYELHPFRDLWEDFGLRGSYEKKVRMTSLTPEEKNNDGAAQVIAAKMAVFNLYQAYSENASKDVSALLDKQSHYLTDDEKRALASCLSHNQVPTSTKVRDLHPQVLLSIYDNMFITQQEYARNSLKENYLKALSMTNEFETKENPEKVAISECNGNADLLIANMNEELKDCQLPPIFLTRTTSPKYNFKAAYNEAVRQGIVKPHTSKNRSERSKASQDDGR